MPSPGLTSPPLTDPAAPFHEITDTTRFHRRRPLFWLSLAFCAGIAIDAIAEPTLRTVGGTFLAAVACAVGVLLTRESFRARRIALLAAGLSVGLASGVMIHALRHRVPPASDISRQTSAAPSFVWLRGTVIDAARPRKPGDRETWTVAVEHVGAARETLTPASGRVRLSVQPADTKTAEAVAAPPIAAEGDAILAWVRLESPPDVTVPGALDFSAYLRNEGIRRVGVASAQSVEVTARASWRPDLHLRRWSSALAANIETLLPAQSFSHFPPESQAGLLNALLFGRRERLSAEDRESFAVSGTAHLLAISGLQIQFFAWLLWRAAALLGLSRRRAATAVLILSCAYCALAGADAPIVRATLMIVVYLGAVAVGREPDPLNVLGISALAILLHSPGELLQAGFQLSFLAVFALVTLLPVFEEAWAQRRRSAMPEPEHPETTARWTHALRQSFFVSLAAWLGTAPVVAWHMGRFSLLSLPLNLIVVPLSSACMVAGLLMLLAAPFGLGIAWTFGWIASASLILLQWINGTAAALPFASLELPQPSLPVMAAYAAILLGTWITRPSPTRIPPAPIARSTLSPLARLASLTVACVVALMAGTLFRDPLPAPTITVLDLRSGRAALVESPAGGAALIDAGGFGQGPRVAEALRHRGIARLTLLVITADEPESIEGALEVLKRIPAARVILPRDAAPSLARRDLERWLATREIPFGPPPFADALQGPGEIRWEFIDDGPAPDEPAAAHSGLAVRVALPGMRVLFATARSGSALTRMLAKDSDRLEADVVRLAVSGGRWPRETGELLRRSGCRSVIAAGGDPREVPGWDLEAFAEANGLRLMSTNASGSLRVQADGGGGSGRTFQSFRNGVWRAE